MLKESELGIYRNEYCPIPESKMKQLSNWLREWKENGIAVNGPAPYAAPIFGVPKKAPIRMAGIFQKYFGSFSFIYDGTVGHVMSRYVFPLFS